MKIISLTVENLFSYKSFHLEFEELSHSLFVGKNGSGKTSIFDILCWVLYGQTPRKKYNKILRDVPTKAKSGSGKVVLDQDGVVYDIIRTISPSGTAVKIGVNGEDVPLRTKTMIQDEIDKILGIDFKTFLNVAYFSQGDIGKFFSSTSTDRIDIVSSVLNLENIDRMLKVLDKELNITERKLSEFKGRKESLDETISSIDPKELNKQKKEFERQIKELEGVREKYESLYIKAKKLKEIEDSVEELQSKFKIKKESAQKLIENNKGNINYLKNKEYNLDDLKSKIKDMEDDLDNLSVAKNSLKEVNDQIQKADYQMASYKTKRNQMVDEIRSLTKILELSGKKCPTCLREMDNEGVENVKKIIKDFEDRKNNLTETILGVEQHIEAFKVRKFQLEDEIEQYKDAQRAKSKYEDQLVQVEKDEKRIIELKEANEKIKKEIKYDLERIKPKIFELKEKIKSKEFKDVDSKMSEEYSDNMNDCSIKIERLQGELRAVIHHKKQYDEAIKAFNKIVKEMEEIQGEHKIKSYWKTALPKVKIRLISEVIPFLENQANHYLGQILPGNYIHFEADPTKKQNKLDIVIEDTVNKITRPIEGWSGGEKDKMSLSVYLALNKLASVRSGKTINFIILDEKLIFIDTETRPLVFEMLRSEYEDRKIWMISHLQDISSEFEQIVKVKKTGGISDFKISTN